MVNHQCACACDYHAITNKELIINKAKQVILAIDASKFDANSLISFGHLSNIDYIVTNIEFDDEWKSILENHSVKVI
ncbi:hypothetical protein FNY53_06450 [Staphylococcus equorum]|uniref:hypothetical protein n=1 Tax=Staphylococcus sp. AntiMn-1 TaxID=1715860 RepID=UPI0009EEB8CB|nr:hypothetical protein [Staphylococcus sp. AntiMn-1]QHD16344.1 hypothetical protein FNY53_06450 [Staphylococcus equorum]